jgi:hypothetical protein
VRTSHLAVVPFFVTGALAACGGSTIGDSGGNSVSGTVAGTSFTVASVIASLAIEGCTWQSDGGDACISIKGKMAQILIADRPDLTCANEFESYANSAQLGLVVINQAGLVAGTYPILTGVADATTMTAAASFSTTTATCARGLALSGTGGTVTLTQVSAASVTGTYNVTFGTQGTFSGSFDLAMCDFPDAGITLPVFDAGPVVCQQ